MLKYADALAIAHALDDRTVLWSDMIKPPTAGDGGGDAAAGSVLSPSAIGACPAIHWLLALLIRLFLAQQPQRDLICSKLVAHTVTGTLACRDPAVREEVARGLWRICTGSLRSPLDSSTTDQLYGAKYTVDKTATLRLSSLAQQLLQTTLLHMKQVAQYPTQAKQFFQLAKKLVRVCVCMTECAS